MVKTKRRLSDAREASLRPMYVSVSFLCFAFFLVDFSWLSVSVPSLLDCLSLVLSSLSLLVAPSPFKNVLRSTPVLRVSILSRLFLLVVLKTL